MIKITSMGYLDMIVGFKYRMDEVRLGPHTMAVSKVGGVIRKVKTTVYLEVTTSLVKV